MVTTGILKNIPLSKLPSPNSFELTSVKVANTPNFDNLLDSYSSAQLLTHEENVGLPSGQMGNSEVGHIHIGAGRIVSQDLLKINNSIESGEFCKKENPP